MLNNKMNKLGVLMIAGLLSSIVFATNGDTRAGPATKYEVTLKKIEFCSDSACTTSHTLVTKTSDMDIASAEVGAEVGSYASTMTLPPMGVTYTHMRSTVDRTMSITGYALSASSGHYCYTNGEAGGKTAFAAGVHTTSAATAAGSATASALEAPTPSVNITTFINGGTDADNFSMTYDTGYAISGDDLTVITALATPYTYYGQTPMIDISFGTTAGVSSVEAGGGTASNDCNLFPGAPAMTITIK